MFREIRRKDRELPMEESLEILKNGEYGVLSTSDQEGQAYGIPLSYVYKDDAIYFHGAKEGHKLDNISSNPKVSFCVVGKTCVVPERFSTNYESVIAFGEIDEVKEEEKQAALMELIFKYSPDFVEGGKLYVEKSGSRAHLFKMNVTHISGKSRK
ncbi:MAG: pyridoxamine 5'-phosphate oxidase family protein [Lacrimispora sp.]|uniref:pyridoxamine 5'-phosphate oxidase family protein n=1 Tax=Lacrimispora sp. TaxID=2719234 RepID=UPI0039E485FA